MSNSLSIFNSNIIYSLLPSSISGKLEQLGSLAFYEIIIPWVVFFLVILVSWYWLNRTKNRFVSVGIYIFIFYSIFRILLFENPAAWLMYRHVLTWKEIGFRETTIIDQNLRRYITPPSNLKYLALGSSQTGALFSDYAHKNRDFYKIEYSGMGPLDYYLYTDLVEKIKPKTLILFLSGFDFGREIIQETMIFAPHQSLPKHLFLIDTLSKKIGFPQAVHQSIRMLLSDIMPEYKYQFLFKGLRDKLINKHSLIKTQAQIFSIQKADDKTQTQVNILLRTLSNKPMDLNFYIFEHFLSEIKKYNINIVIIEGQYHPKAYSEKNMNLERLVSQKMEKLSVKYHFKYISKDKLPHLTPNDFADGYHLNTLGSTKVVDALMPMLK